MGRTTRPTLHRLQGPALAVLILIAAAPPAAAHCDAMDGPVIPEALAALESGDLTPVLKWVPAEHEDQIEQEFARARRLRTRDPEVRAVADQLFLETLIRVHREGEGAPFNGIRPAGAIDPLLQEADLALASGSVQDLSDHLQAAMDQQIRDRFAHARTLQERAGESVTDGRAFVEAYVEYMHFVQALGRSLAHGPSPAAEADHAH